MASYKLLLLPGDGIGPEVAAGMEVVILGGKPIREPVAWAGPFVMNTKAELVQAFEDYQSGRLGQPDVPHAGAGGGTLP